MYATALPFWIYSPFQPLHRPMLAQQAYQRSVSVWVLGWRRRKGAGGGGCKPFLFVTGGGGSSTGSTGSSSAARAGGG